MAQMDRCARLGGQGVGVNQRGAGPSAGFIGLLQLQTRFPRPVGDIGHPRTFDFPVVRRIVHQATAQAVVRDDPMVLRQAFIEAAKQLQAEGALAITTSCGFLALMQQEIAQSLHVPFAASALSQVSWITPLLAAGRRVGILTADASALTPEHLRSVGAPLDAPIAGLDPAGELSRTLFEDRLTLDMRQAEAEVLDAARALVGTHPDIGALVLECTNLPPYRGAILRATGLPVYDCNTLVRWLWQGVSHRASLPSQGPSPT